MRVPVPFTWQEEYLLKGGSKPVTRVFGDLMSIDVPEYGYEDAPSVVSWIETNGEPDGVRNRVDVRMVDGQFYAQVANRMYPAADFIKEYLEDASGRLEYSRLFQHLIQSSYGNTHKHSQAFDDALKSTMRGAKGDVAPVAKMIEHMLCSDREMREREFRSVAENLAIIDGAVWTKASEPTVVIRDYVRPANAVWNGTRDTVACAISASRPSYGSRFISGDIGVSIGLPDTTSVYSMLDWEEACQVHAAIVHPNPDRYTVKRYFEDVVIHDPSVFRFDAVCSPVSRTVAYAVKSFGKDMEAWSRGEANMYMDIRDSLAEFEDTGDVSPLERSVELLRAFMARAGRLDPVARASVMEGLNRWTLDDAGITLAVNDRRDTRSYP